jgi:hypothetical protein
MSTAIGMTAFGATTDIGTSGDRAGIDTSTARTYTGLSRLHLTRRGRVVFTTLAAIPIAAVALALALNGGIAVAEGTSVGAGLGGNTVVGVGVGVGVGVATGFDYVTIRSGQSIWQLAETIAPTSDPRDVIAEIVSLNQLPSESVQPGQRLALPNRF